MSVVCLYWKRFFRLNRTPLPGNPSALRRFLHTYDFYWKLLVAFIPAAVFGLALGDWIDTLLENVVVVAFYIGLFQCIAMIPGVSRSMATIVGGMAQKLSRKAAAEFSFFLAVPTMFAAMGYKILKLFSEPEGADLIMSNMGTLLLGNVVAFVVALLAIKFFIGFVTRYGFKAFGWYRIIVGGVILVMLLMGHNLTIV